jgi:hypothetical protein
MVGRLRRPAQQRQRLPTPRAPQRAAAAAAPPRAAQPSPRAPRQQPPEQCAHVNSDALQVPEVSERTLRRSCS